MKTLSKLSRSRNSFPGNQERRAAGKEGEMLLGNADLARESQHLPPLDFGIFEPSINGDLFQLIVAVKMQAGCDGLRSGGGAAEGGVGAEHDEPAIGLKHAPDFS